MDVRAMNWSIFAMSVLGAVAMVIVLAKLRSWLLLFKATPRSLRKNPRVARLLASQIPFYEYGPERFFCADDAPAEVAERRHAGFMRLAEIYQRKFAKTNRVTDEVRAGFSDLQFTDSKRVPFQFSGFVNKHLRFGGFLESSSGVTITDLDGNIFYDLAASYGVNVFGYDFYKSTIERGMERARGLGPVLGEYHTAVHYNVRRLKEISGLDEISFHMSGTEAIMQAVRLARYHTGRSHLVKFCGAYHGWWGDVQPGVGNPVPTHETYTLTEMSDDSLRVLRIRRDIACVLINPVQALQPNAGPHADYAQNSAPVFKAGTGSAQIDRGAYADWLRRLRAVCAERKIVLIFDEVFVGFHLALGGAQEYFGVRADLVTYGKTVGGGLPVGVVCGRHDLMKRFRDDRPLDVCFARGTFNSHPYVMATMREFLERIEAPDVKELYKDLDAIWDRRTDQLNQRLQDEGVPVRVANISSIWTVFYTQPFRYNWMLQYYLRAEGLALSWTGTGRIIFSLNYTQADFDAVVDRFVAAANTMRQDGWWWTDKSATSKSGTRGVMREMLVQRLLRRKLQTAKSRYRK
jgi:glutamate-1-semialdehyde 2,1-aminomutase